MNHTGTKPRDVRDRIRESVIVDESGCWIWQRYIGSAGYGSMTADGKSGQLAHRVSYEAFIGPIPAGLQIDHLCRVRDCVNPEHLEPVTPRENVMRSPVAVASVHARKTSCANGHEFDSANTYLTPTGARVCRACNRQAVAAYKRRALTSKAS